MKTMKGEGKFGMWLASNMTANNINVNEMASLIGVSRVTVSNHLHRKRRPDYLTIEKYCQVLGEHDPIEVYRLVRKDHDEDEMGNDILCRFGRWVNDSMRKHDLTIEELSSYIDISVKTITAHMLGYQRPGFHTIKRYTEFFNDDLFMVYELTLRPYQRN